MPGPTTRLTLLPYAQSFDGSQVTIRLLVLPGGSPLDPLDPGNPTSPSFANANLTFSLVLTHGLTDMPPLGTRTVLAVPLAAPPQAAALFAELAAAFAIDAAPPLAKPRRNMTVLKHLPASYRDASGVTVPRTPYALMDNSYACAHRQVPTPKSLPNRAGPIPWGKVIAIALRQRALAEALGLIRAFNVPVPAGALLHGGWLHATLDASGDAGLLAVPDALALFATRIAPLTGPAPVFSAVLFPVPPSPTASYDAPFIEAADYADGFLKIVHAAQQRQSDPYVETADGTRPARETGIRIGWDDEQVAIWINRQTRLLGPADPDTQMGTAGYRIDAREVGDLAWHSLCGVSGPLTVGSIALGNPSDEQPLEIHPVQLDANADGEFWLPAYFARWLGGAVVGGDPIGVRLSGGPAPAPNRIAPVEPAVGLIYGTAYEFRVRLADHSSGGPASTAVPQIAAPAPIARLDFRRWVRPGKPRVVQPTAPDSTQIEVRRPRLAYPAYPCTGAANAITDLLADLPAATADGREPGLPDPDVASVRVDVLARALAFDPTATDGYVRLYSAERDFPLGIGDPLTLDVQWRDVHDATTLTDPGMGPLPLPTSRDVRLAISAVGRADPHLDYFGADDVRTGPAGAVALRKNADDERSLLLTGSPADFVRAIFMQPDLADDPTLVNATQAAGQAGQPGDSVARLGAALNLAVDGLTLRAQPGQRLVIGVAGGLRHALGPDHGSVTFASRSELTRRWLVAVRARITRDWTWDGLSSDGIVVSRDGVEVGRVQVLRTLAAEGETVVGDRSGTDLVFFDTVEVPASAGGFPAEGTFEYQLDTGYAGSPSQFDRPLATQAITLPITKAPPQVPQLIAVGIAESPYQHSDDYSSTEPRKRMLWLQFDSDPADPEDTLFARVLRYAPDPLLVGALDARVPLQPVEPPLPIDPEFTRVIIPGQSDDRAGASAMQALVHGDDPGHYLLPLPPGMHDNDPKLLGFFTYEFRYGHAGRWSTAQGRFGTALRVAGVQHPAPALTCSVRRYKVGIAASATYATPVYDGAVLRPFTPTTRLWMLLYAQVWRADRGAHQNVLLDRRVATATGRDTSDKSRARLDLAGTAAWSQFEVASILESIGLTSDAPMSVLAVEVLPGTQPVADPLGVDLGSERILRSSPLVPVSAMCVD